MTFLTTLAVAAVGLGIVMLLINQANKDNNDEK